MPNCSQNCWIDWNSAVQCFKGLFHIWVLTFARFVRPLLSTMLNLVPVYTCITYFPPAVYLSSLLKQQHFPESGILLRTIRAY